MRKSGSRVAKTMRTSGRIPGPHVSYDRKHWFRIPGRLEGASYVFEHTPEHDVCYYAKWAPYPLDRELDLIARCATLPGVAVETVGRTVRGAELTLAASG